MRTNKLVLAIAVALVAAGSTVAVIRPARAQAFPFSLTSFCTPIEDFSQNLRRFRVTNATTATTTVTLFNQTTGQSTSGPAAPGATFFDVPGRATGGNTVILTAEGYPGTTVKASNERACAVVSGNASCNPAAGETTITWTVTNNDTGIRSITASTQPVTFSPNPVPANGGRSIGTQVVTGPASDQLVTNTVTVDLGQGVISSPSATITVPACLGPVPPPPVTFTFTKTASLAAADPGDVVDYVYCGQNTSDIPLEVIRLVDDRLGVVIELPDVDTIVQPGDTLCNTDLEELASYTVTAADAGTTIENNAVVTVRDPATERVFQAVASDDVEVPPPPLPPDPEESTTTTSTTIAATTTTATTAGSGARPTLPATGVAHRATSSAAFGALFVALGAAAVLLARRSN